MPKKDRVSIIQGSGSGHEPAHTMIVGPGMLDAACPGDVFAGPPVEFVTETSKLMDTPAGVLYIVNNYTGDRTAWEMAKELREAEGQKIGYLLVNDDVAVKDSTWTIGRRGVAGNFFVIKAVAAKADKGGTLEECVAVGEKVIANVRTMGVALSSCTPPVRGTPLFEIADGEMEVGIGIHGEPGRQRSRAERDRDRGPPARRDRPRPAVRRGRRGRAHGQRPRRHADHRAVPALRHRPQEAGRRRASRSSAATSASTARRSRWPARTSRSSRSTTSSRSSSSPRPRSRTGSSDRASSLAAQRRAPSRGARRVASPGASASGRRRPCRPAPSRRMDAGIPAASIPDHGQAGPASPESAATASPRSPTSRSGASTGREDAAGRPASTRAPRAGTASPAAAPRAVGEPGAPPFTRGIHATGYRGRPWTMRMFAGFGSAEDTNARFRALLDAGQTGLSIAYDMPTLYGYDTDDPEAEGEFGTCGVAVSSLADMEALLDGLPLDRVSTSMTINAPAAPIWAMYIVGGREEGRPAGRARGHDPERHPQGVRRPEGVPLPAGALDAPRHRHDRVRHARAAPLEHGLDQRLPHPRGRGDGGPGAGLHDRRRDGLRRGGARRAGSRSTTSRRGSRSSSTATPTSSRRSPSSGRRGGSGGSS